MINFESWPKLTVITVNHRKGDNEVSSGLLTTMR